MFEIILMKQKIKWRSKVRPVKLNVYSFFLKILREKNRVMTRKYQKNIAHYHLMYWIYQIFFFFKFDHFEERERQIQLRQKEWYQT